MNKMRVSRQTMRTTRRNERFACQNVLIDAYIGHVPLLSNEHVAEHDEQILFDNVDDDGER